QHGHAHATTPGRVQRVLHGHVVVGEDGLDLDVVALAHLGGHLEVHHVAGVVLDDVNDPGATVDGLGRLQHLVGGRGGEHLARAGGIRHARPNEATVHRLMPRASA